MKAWLVREKDEFEAVVVFAETRGQAKTIALHTDACEGSDFMHIEVQREYAADKYYKPGKLEMDWYDPDDRIALVKDCGFYCEYTGLADCTSCPAKEYCEF